MRTLPTTVTEASRSRFVLFPLLENTTSSNSRSVPYAERYRDMTAVTETPVERIQRAAEDEARRATNSPGR